MISLAIMSILVIMTIFKAKCWMSSMELDVEVEGGSHRAEQYSRIGITRVQ